MKQFFLKLTWLLGLVPAGRYEAVLRTSEELRAGVQAWKERAGEAQARIKVLEAELKDHVRLVREAQRSLERQRHRETDMNRLHEQLASTERELMLAREHLMGVEVKLDILEGAANVLDARTRSLSVGQHDETSAAR